MPGITLLSQAWASSGEAGGHSAALELLMMAVSVVIALIGIGIAYLFYVKNPALPKRIAERQKGLYTLRPQQILCRRNLRDPFRQLLESGWAQASGEGLTSSSSMARSTALPISSGWISSVMRRVQTGFVQNYAFSMVIGGVILAAYYIVRAIFY